MGTFRWHSMSEQDKRILGVRIMKRHNRNVFVRTAAEVSAAVQIVKIFIRHKMASATSKVTPTDWLSSEGTGWELSKHCRDIMLRSVRWHSWREWLFMFVIFQLPIISSTQIQSDWQRCWKSYKQMKKISISGQFMACWVHRSQQIAMLFLISDMHVCDFVCDPLCWMQPLPSTSLTFAF